jgi:hypothetical protein
MTTDRSGTVTGTDPLTVADDLVRAGRVGDAIDLLTEQNRSARRADVERRLVHLRHQLFSQIDTSARPETWPPAGPDDLEGRGLIPVIEPQELTPSTLRAGIVHHGSVHVPGLLGPERVEQLVHGIDESFAAFDAHQAGDKTASSDGWFMSLEEEVGAGAPDEAARRKSWRGGRSFVRRGGGVYTAESPRMLFDVLETFQLLGVTQAIGGYLGERPAISIEKTTLRRASPSIGSADWHQDGAFLGEGVRSVNVWVALTDCGIDAPGLDIVPGRLDQILPRGTHGANFNWSVGHDLAVEAAGAVGTQRPAFKAGDALFFDQWMLHRTAVSPEMTKERYALETWFFAPSAYPKDRTPIVV